jgi:hypothetical protein
VSHEFNANFFIAAATVNPIFFLALTLQSAFYGGLAGKINSAAKTMGKLQEENPASLKSVVAEYIGLGIFSFAIIVLLVGFGGEAVALIALYKQSDDNGSQTFVLWSTIGMVLLAACIPGWTIVQALHNLTAVYLKGVRADAVRMRRAIQIARTENRTKRYKKKVIVDEERTPRE